MSVAAFNELLLLIISCKKEDRKSQKQLYSMFYGYAMGIALRYSQNKEEALEIVNDSFIKVFKGGIQKFNETNNNHEGAFKSWLKRIVINTSIDYYRKNHKNYYHYNIEEVQLQTRFTIQPNVAEQISYEEMLLLVKRLSPAYYTVFCLYVIEGYNHEQIADELGISAGTSKSNLAKARMRLREMIKKNYKDEYARYTG